eukprot:GFKZ01010156.1.p1 GENE.GFKZ01010156.1~~GFKZ01010156.1.p1  ORF type:complete len:534 (-),score=81.17 GFKZ01010156.1:641-2242(-)
MFEIRNSRREGEFFAYVTNETNIRNISTMGYFNINTFLRPILPVTERSTNPFTVDITANDDILLAFLSLILLLVIEGTVATFLLRSKNGLVSNFGFSVKQTIEFLRDFNIRSVYARRGAVTKSSRRSVNKKLILIAVCLLLFTFGLETCILFLTSPNISPVTNNVVTFRIRQPVTPKWAKVAFHNRASWNRPCRSARLEHVHQMETRINVCVITNRDGDLPQPFENITDSVRFTLVTRMHQYGADHTVTLDGNVTNYSTRAYFSLDDKKTRVMAAEPAPDNEPQLVETNHNLFVSYLCSLYNNEMPESEITIEMLNQFSIDFYHRDKENVTVIPGGNRTVEANVYETIVDGVLPTGLAAFHVAQNVFGGAAALVVAERDTTDFFADDGAVLDEEGIVWGESIRLLNWLTLTIFLVISLLVLTALRIFMKPASTAEIAGIYVKEEVGAILARSPVEVADEELEIFWVRGRKKAGKDEKYVYGAETLEKQWEVDQEYRFSDNDALSTSLERRESYEGDPSSSTFQGMLSYGSSVS